MRRCPRHPLRADENRLIPDILVVTHGNGDSRVARGNPQRRMQPIEVCSALSEMELPLSNQRTALPSRMRVSISPLALRS